MTQSPDSQQPLLSVAVIAKNEADRIRALLDSVKFADEVLVVDSGSTDETVELCRSLGARVIHQDWMGYAAQKQFAMDSASGQWVLSLDADEAISPESANEITAAIRSCGHEVHGFSLPRLSRYLNRWIRHGGWYPDRKIRLVQKGFGTWTGDGLHEKLEVSGIINKLQCPILHYVYRDISDQIDTINRFSTVHADHRRPAGPIHILFGLFHAAGKFLECAIWKLGILDGIPGFIIAVNSSFYVFLKHAKAWEKSLPDTNAHSKE
ncbi:glycosyltransferase family 2 protein [Desulfomonile tiedjei]|uniref:Glycosyl transferase n=1 Tax=Desulfomonile tiedjei (strain ATCC 49306 / DSM 6799 / DCB-1) TaxID=706587 RepID=I4C6U2_DESTA|nr:glycosyltransferase family 2 protein [Desulfomonile tiedjei]AFM25283.1 glycosyl transferase [Desulfomonile tiedjei DSM 6799]